MIDSGARSWVIPGVAHKQNDTGSTWVPIVGSRAYVRLKQRGRGWISSRVVGVDVGNVQCVVKHQTELVGCLP